MRKWCAMYPICQHLNSIIECRRYWESPFANMTSARCRSASVESRVTARAAVASRSRRGRVVNTWTTWCNKRRRRTTEYFIKYVNSRPRPAQLNNNYDAEKPQRRRIQHNTCQLNRSTTQIEFRLRVVAIAAHRVRDRHTACLYVPNTPCTFRRTTTIPPLPYDAVNGDCMI